MRFESLTLEHYGRTKETILDFPASPGLALIFGPNEAGKSTSLEAISDFLYGVPERSARGQIFGADKIAIKATIVRADGTRLALKRRKGRGRTLTDAAGQTLDEAVLGLGATSRERFAALFGLNHASLRSGGEHLLAGKEPVVLPDQPVVVPPHHLRQQDIQIPHIAGDVLAGEARLEQPQCD